MKIGEFAKKFNTNINTVRYYVNTGLLVPDRHNNQYRFKEQCVENMKLILMLKEFDFSISRIHDILSLMRFSNLTAQDDISDYLAILEDQKGLLSAKLNKLQLSAKELDAYTESIRKLANKKPERPPKTGVPVEFMQYLCCPHCDIQLSFDNANMENGQIINAELACKCGYKASIMNGILITEERNISELDFPDLDRKFYKDLPASWVSLFQKSYNWIYNRMNEIDLNGKIVLETHINCYFFLYTVLNKLNRNALYIISDKYVEMVTIYKELIENQNLGLKILFMADSSFKYPLKKSCVDLYVDYCAMNEYSIFNSDSDLFDVLMPYLKQEVDMLGTYFYFDSGSNSHRHLLQEYPICLPQNYLLPHYRECVRRNKLKQIESGHNGYVTDGGSGNRNFSFHAAGDRMHLFSYHCQR